MNNTEQLINHLIEIRKKYDLFSIERCAADTEVSSQTVRNFENRVATNADVVLYYISNILWKLEHDEFFLANKAGVNENEVKADRQNTIFWLMMSFK